jgi:large subunit ribosomal protein L4
MIDVPVFNQEGQQVETFSVDPAKLGGDENGQPRAALLKQAIVHYHANQRQGTVQTQARGEVAGSTRKMFKQKGTGNARTGGIRNPIKVGGGHAKQKRPKEWRQDLPQKQKRLARNNAILSKIISGDVKIVTGLALAESKTKLMAAVVKGLGIDRSCLLALPSSDASVYRAARNLDRMTVSTVSQINAWDILRNRTLLITKDGLNQIIG